MPTASIRYWMLPNGQRCLSGQFVRPPTRSRGPICSNRSKRTAERMLWQPRGRRSSPTPPLPSALRAWPHESFVARLGPICVVCLSSGPATARLERDANSRLPCSNEHPAHSTARCAMPPPGQPRPRREPGQRPDLSGAPQAPSAGDYSLGRGRSRCDIFRPSALAFGISGDVLNVGDRPSAAPAP